MLARLAGERPNVFHVDVRGTVRDEDWGRDAPLPGRRRAAYAAARGSRSANDD